MLHSWTLRLTVLFLLGVLLLAHSRNVRFTAPGPSDMEAKRREWETNYIATQGPPAPMHEVRELQIPGSGASIPVRIYRPLAWPRLPTLVWFHGGGFAHGSLDSHDSICRAYAQAFEAVVVSVAYRLAPEHPFPAGLEDCYAATAWAYEHAGEIGGDAETLAIGGDSAGGNLAAGVTLVARDRVALGKNAPIIRFQALISPVLAWHTPGTESYVEFADGIPSRKRMEEVLGMYLADGDSRDPLAFPLNAADLSGLPPALILVAERDVLRDEAEAYGARLLAARVDVTTRRFRAGHVGMSSLKASANDFYLGLALMKTHWLHALGNMGPMKSE